MPMVTGTKYRQRLTSGDGATLVTVLKTADLSIKNYKLLSPTRVHIEFNIFC